MSTEILVINEPFVKDFCRTQRWAARTRGRVLRAPDWLAYATAVLERAGHKVRLLDMVARGESKEDLRRMVTQEKPRFVVLDSTTPSIHSDIGCAALVKEASNARVIMVGPHISVLPIETLRAARGVVDVACIGEYDCTVREVIENFSNLDVVPGIAYYKNGEISTTGARPLLEDLDTLPFPAWEHLDLMKYFDGGKLYPYIDIISGRGCPNQCIFCLWPQVMHGTRYRFRRVTRVVDEIEHDIKLCPQVVRGGEFFFEDDTFTADRARAMLLCEEILRRNLKITFSVNARVDTADSRMFSLMKRAGCRELLVGFESGAQEVLDTAHKNITIEQSRQFMREAKKAGLEVHGCFVIGLPGETQASAQKTIDFALSLGCDTIQFSGAVPFPGTRFFTMAQEEGWLTTTEWQDWLDGGEQKGVISYPHLSQRKIDSFVDEGLRKFYLRPSYILKFLFKTRSTADLYRKLRGAKNYLGYLFSSKQKSV
ncbi:MAG: radical SAM protein [Candidatus Omnitrophota bacterium]